MLLGIYTKQALNLNNSATLLLLFYFLQIQYGIGAVSSSMSIPLLIVKCLELSCFDFISKAMNSSH